jgi:hypothetical protein
MMETDMRAAWRPNPEDIRIARDVVCNPQALLGLTEADRAEVLLGAWTILRPAPARDGCHHRAPAAGAAMKTAQMPLNLQIIRAKQSRGRADLLALAVALTVLAALILLVPL